MKDKPKLVNVEITPAERELLKDVYARAKAGDISSDLAQRYPAALLWALVEKHVLTTQRLRGTTHWYLTGTGVALAKIIENEQTPYGGAWIKPGEMGKDE